MLKTLSQSNSRIIIKALAIGFFSILLLLNLAQQSFATAGINRTINFQGKVVNKTPGTNVTNGAYDFTFKLYDAASAGSLLWTENWTGGNQITVTDGIFRASLGSITTFASAGVDFNTDNLYLDITFNGEAFTSSRIRFAAVPYAINAEKVAGLTVTNTTGTFTLTNAKTFSVSNTLSFSGTDSTSFVFPSTSGGTVLTTTAPSQAIASAQTSGTVLSLTDSAGLAGNITGFSVNLTSSTNTHNKTGLAFDLSGGTGGTYYDLLGSGSTWNVTRAGVLTVASCSGCGAGASTLQGAYEGGTTISVTSGEGALAFDLASANFDITAGEGADTGDFRLWDGSANWIFVDESADTLALGAAAGSGISLGGTGITTTNAGLLSVTEGFSTDSTTTLGNAATDTITLTGSFNSNLNFLDAATGTAYILSGSDASGATNAGGNLTLNAGAGNTSGTGGGLLLNGGAGGATGSGGNTTISAGVGGATSGNGGNLILAGGTVTSGTAGYIAFQAAGSELFRIQASGTFLFEKGASTDVILAVTAASGGDRTLTVPQLTADDSFALVTKAQTLASKTLTSPTLTTSPTAAGATWADLGTVTTIDINGGTIDGTSIGASSRSTANITNLDVNGTTVLGDAAADTITLTGSFNSNVNFLDAATGSSYNINGSDATGATNAGGAFSIRAGNGGATSGNGGDLTLSGGTTNSGTAGYIAFQTGGSEVLRINPTGTFLFEKGASTDVILAVTAASGGDRTLTVPQLTADDSFALVTKAQTLASKTLTSPTLTTSPTAAGATWADLGTVTTIDINGGTIDGATIGGSSAGAGTFTALGGADLTLGISDTSATITTQDANENLYVDPNGTGYLYVGNGSSSTSPNLFVLDVKSDAEGALTGVEGAMYYNDNSNKFRCYQNTAWTDCIGTGGAGPWTDGTGITYLTDVAEDLALGGSNLPTVSGSTTTFYMDVSTGILYLGNDDVTAGAGDTGINGALTFYSSGDATTTDPRIYTDSSGNLTIAAEQAGASVVLGDGSGNVSLELTGLSDLFLGSKTYTLVGADYTSSDFQFKRNLTSDNAGSLEDQSGAVLYVEDISTGVSQTTANAALIKGSVDFTGASFVYTGNLLDLSVETVTQFKVDYTGLTSAADLTLGLDDSSATISTADTDEALTIDPDGTGQINFHSGSYNITSAGALTVASVTVGGDTINEFVSNGLEVSSNALRVKAVASADALSATTSSGSGLEVLSGGVSLLQGCSTGQILKWNETTDVWACGADAGADGVTITTFTADGTWTKSNYTGLKFTEIIVTGSGGGGGGADTDGTGEAGAGGGGAGGTTIEIMAEAALGATEAIDIGTAGTAGAAASGGSGGNGGASTFGGTDTTANGGSLGTGTGAAATIGFGAGGAGGAATTDGDVETAGGAGQGGSATLEAATGGHGGSSYWGGGGKPGTILFNTAACTAGSNGGAFGSGGGGAGCEDNTSGAAGGVGAAGVVVTLNYTSSSGDYAEFYETEEGVEAGDVVAISENSLDYDSKLGLQKISILTKATPGLSVVGVVSSSPYQTIGGDILENAKRPRAIALAGRVPVKVTESNGKIKAGDLLAPSSIAGFAKKSTKAGATIGKALEDSNCEEGKVCKVLTIVSTSYTTGALLKEAMKDDGVSLDGITTDLDYSRIFLAQMLQNKQNIVDAEISEIYTDRLAAGIEIITPRLVADEIIVRNIKAETIEGLDGKLSSNLEVMRSLIEEKYGSGAATLSEEEDIASQSAVGSPNGLDLANMNVEGVATISGSLRVKGNSLIEGILTVIDTLKANDLIASGLSTFFGEVVFKEKAVFEGDVVLGSNMGGTTSIKKGQKSVAIKFNKQFEEDPIVNVTIYTTELTTDVFEDKVEKNECIESEGIEACEEKLAENILSNNSYVVTKKSKKGFSILLKKEATADVNFSWTVVNIRREVSSL